jgi:hypothetical protein
MRPLFLTFVYFHIFIVPTFIPSHSFNTFFYSSPLAEVPLYLLIACQLSGKNLPGVPYRAGNRSRACLTVKLLRQNQSIECCLAGCCRVTRWSWVWEEGPAILALHQIPTLTRRAQYRGATGRRPSCQPNQRSPVGPLISSATTLWVRIRNF